MTTPIRRATCTTVALAIALALLAPGPPAFGKSRAPRVVLDPGHGGVFTGAANCNFSFAGSSCLREADVNLDMVKRAARILRGWGFRTIRTRTRDTTVLRPLHNIKTWNQRRSGFRFYKDRVVDVHDDLQARVNLANCGTRGRACDRGDPDEADAFVSIHNNACGGCGASGTITFHYRREGARLARLINREVTQRIRDDGGRLGREQFYVVHWTRMASALLEAGFVDNNHEARRMLKRSFREKVGRGVAAGVAHFLCDVKGTRGRDVLRGGRGKDVLCGLGGRDKFIASGGKDTIVGGAGADKLTYAGAPNGVDVNLSKHKASGWGRDLIDSVGKVVGSPFDDSLRGSGREEKLSGKGGNDVVSGRGDRDRLSGGRGADVLRGRDGRDSLDAGPGRDRLKGNDGDDRLSPDDGDDLVSGGSGDDVTWFSGAPDRVTIDLAAGTASGQGSDVLVGIEDIVGSSFADLIAGSATGNRLDGANGNDSLLGRGGWDHLFGGDGDDRMDGGLGRDECNQGLGSGTKRSCER